MNRSSFPAFLWVLLTALFAGASETSTLRLLTFNILAGGNAVPEIGATSPLHQESRHADIAAVILQSGADIVGVLEPAAGATDPILTRLQADDPAWQKRGNLYAKFPIEEDPRNPGAPATHLVRTGPEQFVICHVAHWRPSNYGPFFVQERIIAGTVPADPDQFNEEVVAAVRKDSDYRGTLAKVQPHLKAGRPVFVLGDFNEPSHLDWTAAYAARGADRWVANPTDTPLRFQVTWPGSSLLLGAGLKDSYRTIFPDPVAKPGNTWTPPYSNDTSGRRPYDEDSTPSKPSRNQVSDRIDRLLFAGNGVTATAAAVVGENPANPEHANKSDIIPDIQYEGSWPSDHRAILGTFTLPTVTGPAIPGVIPSELPARDSADFAGGIDPIEGDVDPTTLASFQEEGRPNTTVNDDGTLTMITPADAYPAWKLAPGDYLDSATGWTWETRFRIEAANDPDRGVWEIFLRDNDNGLAATRIHFLATGLDRDNQGNGVSAEIAANLSDDFHIVRGAVEGGTNLTTVWLDGVKVIDRLPSNTFEAPEAGWVGRWGAQTRGGTTTIDYIRFDTTGAYAPPGGENPDQNPPPSPDSGSSINRAQPLYWWPDERATGYRVWFGPSADFSDRDDQGGRTSNFFDPGPLLENTTYHWRVDVITTEGSVIGPSWSFTTTNGHDLVVPESYLGWKLTHFPTAILRDPDKETTHWGPAADPDRDSLPTLLECALAGDPLVPDPEKRPRLRFFEGVPVFSFRQRASTVGSPGLDSTARGVVCRVEIGPDLMTWNHGPEWIENVGPPIDNGDGTVTVRVRLPATEPGCWFARLSVFEAQR